MKTDNELIAEFMGYEKVTVGYFGSSSETEWQARNQDWMEDVELNSIGDYIVKVKDNEWIDWKDVAYDKSWDWLMPVVEKINSLKHDVHIYPTRARFYKNRTEFIESIHPGYSLIEVAYCGVVEFIKWYNLNHTKPMSEPITTKTPKEFIKKIKINVGNLSHIMTMGEINGTLLIDLEKAMKKYATQQVAAERERIKNAIRELPDSRVGFSDWEYLVKSDVLKLIDNL